LATFGLLPCISAFSFNKIVLNTNYKTIRFSSEKEKKKKEINYAEKREEKAKNIKQNKAHWNRPLKII
jgi:hypothetical protein